MTIMSNRTIDELIAILEKTKNWDISFSDNEIVFLVRHAASQSNFEKLDSLANAIVSANIRLRTEEDEKSNRINGYFQFALLGYVADYPIIMDKGVINGPRKTYMFLAAYGPTMMAVKKVLDKKNVDIMSDLFFWNLKANPIYN